MSDDITIKHNCTDDGTAIVINAGDDDKRLHRPGVNEVTHWARVPLPEER